MDMNEEDLSLAGLLGLMPWHGYDRSNVQWMLTQQYQSLDDARVGRQLVEDFMTGKTQVRMQMQGFNVEIPGQDCIYAFKSVLRQDRHRLLMLRIDPRTGQPLDVKETISILPEHATRLSLMNDDGLNMLFVGLFDKAAQWHRDTFGVGPVGPALTDENDVDRSTQAMAQWANERAKTLNSRTPDATPMPPRPSPRL